MGKTILFTIYRWLLCIGVDPTPKDFGVFMPFIVVHGCSSIKRCCSVNAGNMPFCAVLSLTWTPKSSKPNCDFIAPMSVSSLNDFQYATINLKDYHQFRLLHHHFPPEHHRQHQKFDYSVLNSYLNPDFLQLEESGQWQHTDIPVLIKK